MDVTIVVSYLLSLDLQVGEQVSYSCYPNPIRALVGIELGERGFILFLFIIIIFLRASYYRIQTWELHLPNRLEVSPMTTRAPLLNQDKKKHLLMRPIFFQVK